MRTLLLLLFCAICAGCAGKHAPDTGWKAVICLLEGATEDQNFVIDDANMYCRRMGIHFIYPPDFDNAGAPANQKIVLGPADAPVVILDITSYLSNYGPGFVLLRKGEEAAFLDYSMSGGAFDQAAARKYFFPPEKDETIQPPVPMPSAEEQ